MQRYKVKVRKIIMKNFYTEPKLEVNAFQIRERISNTQDTELSVIEGWPTGEQGSGTGSEVQQGGQ